MITISICLSEIPKDRIKKADNGKCYVNLVLNERKEVDKFGNTHTVTVSKTKEEREANAPTVYVGSGKLYEVKPTTPTPEQVEQLPSISEDDDLPF